MVHVLHNIQHCTYMHAVLHNTHSHIMSLTQRHKHNRTHTNSAFPESVRGCNAHLAPPGRHVMYARPS